MNLNFIIQFTHVSVLFRKPFSCLSKPQMHLCPCVCVQCQLFLYVVFYFTQLKESMVSIIDQLGIEDRFNILTFSGEFLFWKDTMVPVSDEDMRENALEYINKISVYGGKHFINIQSYNSPN